MENSLEKQIKVMQAEIKDLQSKHSEISQDVKMLKSNQESIQANMNTLCGSLEKINKNVENMIEKLDSVSMEQQKSTVDKMMHHKGGLFNTLVKTPIRKLAVGTVGLALAVGDYTVERLSNAKEGMEDIVAEAHYNRKSRQAHAAEA